MGEQRQTLGERLSQRLSERTARRLRFGPSPAFLARLGLADSVAPGSTPGGGDFTYVSGTPFYEMMQRLSRARLRRQQRLSRYERAASRRKVSASRRLWPQKRRASFLFGPQTLGDSDFVLPEHESAEVAEEEEQSTARPRVVSGWTGKVKSPARRSTWFSRATLPSSASPAPQAASAQAATPAAPRSPSLTSPTPRAPAPHRAERPIARLGRRLSASVVAQDPVVRAVKQSGRPLPRRLVRVITSVEDLPPEQQVRIIRREARRMGATVRVVREQLDRHAPDAQASPVSVAAGRMAPAAVGQRAARRRGLRPVMSRSPMMKALAPPPVAPDLQEARQQPAPKVSRPSPFRSPRTAAPRPATSAATRTSRAPRGAPRARAGTRARPPSSASGDAAGSPPPPSALSSSQPTARTAHTAHLAARAIIVSDGAARRRSVMPVVAPSSAARPAPAAPASTPVGAARAARRSLIGQQRPGSMLPRVVATDAPESAGPQRFSQKAPARTPAARGGTRRMAAVIQAPDQKVIAPEVPTTGPAEAAAAPAPRRSAWKQPTRPSQRALQRTVSVQTRSLVPRPVIQPEAPLSQGRGAPARRALSRRSAAEPVGRSSLPRLTRTTPDRPRRASVPGASVNPSPGLTQRALTRADSATGERSLVPRAPRTSARTGAKPRNMGLSAPNTVLPESAPTASPEDSPEAAAPTVGSPWGPSPKRTASPVQAAARRSEIGEETDRSVLPRVRARRLDAVGPGASIAPREPSSATQRDARPRRMRTAAPSAVDIQPTAAAEPSASQEVAAAPQRSAWGPSPKVVSSSRSSASTREAARQLASTPPRRRKAAIAQAASRARTSPLVGYSARSASHKTRRSTVDVAVRRSVSSPVSYARRTRTARTPGSVIFVQLPEPTQAPAAERPPAPEPKVAPRRPASVLDLGPSVPRPGQQAPVAPATSEAPVTRLAKADGPIDRPLDRIGERFIDPEDGLAPLPTRRGGWAEGRTLVGERSERPVRMSVGSDGVYIQPERGVDDADAPAAVAAAPRRGPWMTSAPSQADTSLPAPWSRPVWSRGRRPQPSSRLRTSALSRAGKSSGGVYMSQRTLGGGRRMAAPVRDFQYPGGDGGRPPLPWTLEAVDAKSTNQALPGWAQRASGKSLTGGDDFLRQLARAGEVSEVVRVIFERSGQAPPTVRHLSSPVLQVIQQIRAEAYKAGTEDAVPAQKTITATASGGGPRKAMRRGGAQPRMQQIARGMTGLRTMASAPSSDGVGEDKVSKLARRLRDLIHLAEVKDRRDEARQGVRMAEDSASARAEGQSAPTQAEGGGNKEQVDIDALSREVLDCVQRETQLRSERRIDGGDTGDFWW